MIFFYMFLLENGCNFLQMSDHRKMLWAGLFTLPAGDTVRSPAVRSGEILIVDFLWIGTLLYGEFLSVVDGKIFGYRNVFRTSFYTVSA